MEAKEAALPLREGERSDVVGANVLQVVELQLQLAYPHVLGGQLLLQAPQLVLLPEEHPQELWGWKGRETVHVKYAQHPRPDQSIPLSPAHAVFF